MEELVPLVGPHILRHLDLLQDFCHDLLLSRLVLRGGPFVLVKGEIGLLHLGQLLGLETPRLCLFFLGGC